MSLTLFTTIFSFKPFLLLIILFAFLFGLIDYSLLNKKNKCQMTFMFQVPQFIPIALKNNVIKKFPNYNLYAYGEGEYADFLRLGQFDGLPVLFVPGNSGSHKQVRSLASVALRMTYRYSISYFLNYFTIDFNTELSGVISYQLKSQTEFLKESVIKIIEIYESEGKNVSLVLIGHSIGGLIIRSMLSLHEFRPYLKKINLVITLATPQNFPVVPIDSEMLLFYENVGKFWKHKRENLLSHMNLISIGGGFSDKLVRSDLTKLDSEHINDLSIVTTSIDDVWVPMDHVCIVWCKQLVLKLTRLLFDLIDAKSLEMIESHLERNKRIKYHLMERTLGINYPKFFMSEYTSLSGSVGDWNENKNRIIRISKPKIVKPTYILLPLLRRETIVIQFEGLYKYDWIMACNATKVENKTVCDKGLNLHPYVKLMPFEPHDTERRILRAPSATFMSMGFSHLLVGITPTTQPINILIDRFTSSIRSKNIILPNLWQSLTLPFSAATVLNIAISEETSFYNLSLIGLNQIWHSYWIKLDTISCYPTAKQIGFLYFSVPWNRENQFEYIYPKRGMSSEMTLKVNTPKPNQFGSDKQPLLYLILDPDCGYELYLKPSLSEIMGQIIRHYGVIILPMIVSIILSVLSEQLITNRIKVTDELSNANSNIGLGNSFFIKKQTVYYLQSVIILKNIKSVSIYGILILSSVSLPFYSNYYDTSFASKILNLTNTQLILLYSVLFLISYSITYFFSLFITLIFTTLSSLLIFLQLKIDHKVSKSVKKSNEKMENSITLKKLPILGCLSMLFCAIFVSSLTFLLGLIIHNIQLIILSINCQSIERRKGLDCDSSLCNLHLTLLALFYFSTIPTIPFLLDWLNLKMPFLYFGFSDPHILSAIYLSLSCAIIWQQLSARKTNEYQRRLLSYVIKGMAIYVSIFSQINYAIISQVISLSCLIICVHNYFEWYTSRHIKND